MPYRATCALAVCGLLLAACGGPESSGEPETAAAPKATTARLAPSAAPVLIAVDSPVDMPIDRLLEVPLAMRSCAGCHAGIVRSYLAEHGMARSVGPVGKVQTGRVAHPSLGRTYETSVESDGAWLTTVDERGGRRRQRLVGRIGAGNFGNSWVTAEADVANRVPTDRLFFAPLESMGAELVLSPFEEAEPAAGADMALTEGCLGCHIDQPLVRLPGAAVGKPPAERTLFPANALGRNAFEHLDGIGCAACHGDAEFHLAVIAGDQIALDNGITALGSLAPQAQLDVCARCHLQGESRWDLQPNRASGPRPATPLAATLPVLVSGTVNDDFRFVSQLERLALSACFRETEAMTCTTCHDPHRGARAQGAASFDAACIECHRELGCSRPETLNATAVTGEPARTADGCVDCHVRRSQPFDLTHVRSADHWVRRKIPLPESNTPHRAFTEREGPLRLWGRERLESALKSPAGQVWESAVLGMGLVTFGRFEEAARELARLPAPGSQAAVTASAPAPLTPVLDNPNLHQARGMVLLAVGDIDGALAAFTDAISLEPTHPGALLARARVRLDRGDVTGAHQDTQTVIESYPQAEQPWRLRIELAERIGRLDVALTSLEALTERWPSDPVAWQKLGLILEQQGESVRAADAFARSQLLAPGLDLRLKSE